MNRNRLIELDALRGLAAVAVVIYHFFYRYNALYGFEPFNANWAYIGNYGVHLFFLISGFVIFWSVNRVKKPSDFIAYRFARLYPVFWLSIVLTSVLVAILGLPDYERSLIEILQNTLMFHEYLNVPHVDGVYWTLTIELTFYFWIFVLYLTNSLPKVELLCIPLLLLSACQALELIEVKFWVEKIFFLKFLPFFASGICFYNIVLKSVNRLSIVTLLLCLVCLWILFSPLEAMIFYGIYLVFFLAVSGYLRFLAAKPLIFMGAISYSLYLLHQNIGYAIINRCLAAGLSNEMAILTAVAVSLVLATVATYLVEKPANDMIRKFYRNFCSRKQNKKIKDHDISYTLTS